MRLTKQRGNYLWPVIYGVLLTAYAVFTLLDAFVIPRDIVPIEEFGKNSSVSTENVTKSRTTEEALKQLNNSEDTEAEESQAEIITDNSYICDEFSITITELERYKTRVYVADVVLQDGSYLKAGLAGNSFGRNVSSTTSAMAEENNAVLAVNGDYYGFRDRGYVMRNGYLYRETAQRESEYEDLVIYEDGSMEIVEEAEVETSELVNKGAVQIFSFGPGLIQNGEITVDESSEVEQAMRSNPRTAIGEIEPLHYVLVVSDGRTRESAGLTLFELAQVMQELNCRTAYNLDGGGSSTMWFMGEVINHPTDGRRDGERRVSDIVYIGK